MTDVDKIIDSIVNAVLNRHETVISMVIASGLITGDCLCGWNWDGGWVTRTPANLKAIEDAMKAHLDDVISYGRE